MAAVLPISREKHSQFTPDPLHYPTAQRYFLEEPSLSIKSSVAIHSDYSSTDSLSPIPSPVASSGPSSPASSSISPSVDGDDDEIIFPIYDVNLVSQKDINSPGELLTEHIAKERSVGPLTDGQRRILQSPAADDGSLEQEPSRHVDYLSHEWKQEDIWASWRYVTLHRDAYSNGVRLENASWRMWTKLKFGLGTISPEKLNWLKDCDVTWLYGPLKTSRMLGSSASPPPTRLETPNLYQDRKPILKKKTASEAILQRSLSQHTLLQHAGAILRAKESGKMQNRPFPRPISESKNSQNQTGSSTPTVTAGSPMTTSFSGTGLPDGERHIHFNNEVAQCIAVDCKVEDEMDEDRPAAYDDSAFSDDVYMTKKDLPSAHNTRSSRNSFCSENKIIAPLPSTTLKYRGDTPESPAGSFMERWFGACSSRLPSPEQVRSHERSEPCANFLLDYYDDHDDGLNADWRPKLALDGSTQNRSCAVNSVEEELELDQDLNLTSSDMFISGDWESSNAGIFDRVVDTVNTAKDIAHVIWNVGWRR